MATGFVCTLNSKASRSSLARCTRAREVGAQLSRILIGAPCTPVGPITGSNELGEAR